MCNVADHAQNVAKKLRAVYSRGVMDMLFAQARHDLTATRYDSSELMSTQDGRESSRDYSHTHVHVRSDLAQGRQYRGVSSMRVLKVPFRARRFVTERLVADQVAVAPDTCCLLSFTGITPCVRSDVSWHHLGHQGSAL